MIENLLPIKIPPGIYANGTNYQKSGRWAEGNCIRFHQGTVQPIGGWRERILTGDPITGTVHAQISWLLQDGTPLMAVGTEDGLYIIESDNTVTDITPADAGGNASGSFNWQLSVFGAYLLAVNSLLGDDDLSAVNTFIWTGVLASPAAAAWTTVNGPRGAYSAFVTPERFLTVLRGKDQTSHTARSGVDTIYSERRVYFASQETLDEFTSTDTNSGGDFDLQTDGRLMVGVGARGQSLVWTDTDLWTMNFLGGELVYGFQKAGDNCGIISKRAFVLLDKGAFWMSRDKFFVFDGFVRNIPCEVTDAVFGDFNDSYAHKVWAVANPKFNEITWFYPSLSGLHARADKFVTYNYEENHWTLGTLTRSAGVPRRHRFDVVDEPLPVWFDGAHMYEHETGHERGTLPFLTSGPIELGNGDRLMRLQGILPDDLAEGDVQLRLYLGMSPDSAETLAGPYSLSAYTPLRKTARQVRIRLEEVTASSWRVGNVRLCGLPAERRGVAAGAPRDLVPASLEIIPTEVTLATSQHFTFDSIVRNGAGEVLDIDPDVWTSDNDTEIPVDDTGTVTVLAAPAVAHIQAFITSPALSSNIATVTSLGTERVPFSIEIPATLSMEQLETEPIAAIVRDQFGVVITDVDIDVWATTNAAIASAVGTTLDNADVTSVTTDGTCNITATISTGVVTPVVSNNCVVTVATSWIKHTFTIGSFDFNVSAGSGDVEALIVAGGGGGAGTDGSGVGVGGGGGGGVVHESAHHVAVGSHLVRVGGGGAQGHYDHFTLLGNDGGNGGDSEFDGTIATGGGGGALFGMTSLRDGHDGGSGGGGASASGGGGTGAGGARVVGQGNVGTSVPQDGGHGGGGGGAGAAGVGRSNGGNGVNYTTANITGTPVTYGGGGGGGSETLGGSGGSGGTGGGGSAPGGAGTNGTANLGGGGGAGSGFTAGGGFGGDGVVIIKYRSNTGIVATGGTKVTLP